MASDETLEHVTLVDFRAGIASGWVTSQSEQEWPDGFAQESETFGCYALPTGGLAALPRITYEIEGAEPTTGFTEGFTWPERDGYEDRIAVLDMMAVSPVHYIPDLETSVSSTLDPVDVMTVRQWWMVDGTDVASIYRYKGFPAYKGNPEAAYAQRHLDTQDFLGDMDYWRPHYTRWLYGWGSLMGTRTQSEDNSTNLHRYEVGPPVTVFGMGTYLRIGTDDAEGIEASGYWSYPDFKDTNEDNFPVAQDRTIALTVPLNGAPPGIVFGHQGKLCSIGRPGAYNVFRLLGYHGDQGGQRASSEIVSYWPTNAIYAGSISWATFLEEATTGYGTWSSVNANSLLLVKNKGGGVLVNGPLEAPQVTRLPGLPSVGGLANRGVVVQRAADGPTEQGFVYGSSTGVWLWTGSDSALELSPQLESQFWVPDDITIDRRQPGQLIGSFAFTFPYVYAPNNWMYDMRGGGWWRYHPTPDQHDATDGTVNSGTIFAFHDSDCNGNIWAMPASYQFDTRMMAKFDMETPRDRWSWLSQPIVKSRGRMLDVRSIEIKGSGAGRITVDVIGDDGLYQSAVMDNETGDKKSILQPISIHTKDVTVRVRAEAYDPDLPAPTFLGFDIGYRPTQSIGGGR